MEFSIRDNRSRWHALARNSGQAVIEYILVLVVTVGLVLGGLYQLDSAFKAWADNYFGEYIACLLESGELPSLDGGAAAASDGCAQAFKPFSLADGQSGLPGGSGGSQSQTRPPNPTTPPKNLPVSKSSGTAGGGSTVSPAFSNRSRSSSNFSSGGSGKKIATNTGDTSASIRGGYNYSGSQVGTIRRQRIDTGFAFQKEVEEKEKRSPSAVTKPGGLTDRPSRVIPKHKRAPAGPPPDDSPMTFGNFIRYLIIAALIIALLLVIGGQMLQVGKSME